MTIKQFKKLARATARRKDTSYQAELDAIAQDKGYRSWGDFQKSLTSTPLSKLRIYEVDHVADLLDALSTCMLRGQHLVVNRDGDNRAEQDLIDDLKSYIATLTGGEVGRVRWGESLVEVDLDHAKEQYLTWVVTSRGMSRLISHGNHMVLDEMAQLSDLNALAKLSERNLIETTMNLTLAIAGKAENHPAKTDTIGKTTVTRVSAKSSHTIPARTFIDLFLGGAPDTEEDRALLEDALNGYMSEPAGTNIADYVEGYEFRGDDFDLRPDDRQREMMRRAIAEWFRMGPTASAPIVNPTFQMDETRYLRGPRMPYETEYHLRDAWNLPEASRPPELKKLNFVPAWNPLSDNRIPHAAHADQDQVNSEYVRQICAVLLDESGGYFESNARKALNGFILMHMDEARRAGSTPSMPGVVDMLRDILASAASRHKAGREDDADTLRDVIKDRISSMTEMHVSARTEAMLSTVLAAAARERSAILGTMDKALLVFRNPTIRARTSP